MFGTLGGPELFLILVIALIVFGPKKLPEMGRSLGKMMAEFRKASSDFKRTLEEEVEADRIRELAAPPRTTDNTFVRPVPPSAYATPHAPHADPQQAVLVAEPAAETVHRGAEAGADPSSVEPK